jgi:hypothetical protein
MGDECDTFVGDGNADLILGSILRGNVISKFILKTDVKCKDVN